jgi:predicted KAP-like P-loop ATPase
LLADKAVANAQEDKFQRYAFASQLATTICERRSAESLVLGLYGKWGAGKSSVLNFVRAELARTDVLTVTFNPWRFDDEEQLLQGFFAELALALQTVVTPEAKNAAQKAVAQHSQQIVAKLQLLDRDSRAESLKGFKSQAKLEEIKQHINELLRVSGRRVLVLIDDIDRLSAPEIHAILRLVKLTGDFQYTTYLLAFDEAIVARAIGERYAGGGKRDGQRYLEKIIQVPLQLPIIQQQVMQKYFQESFLRSLLLTNIQLSEGEHQRLISILADSILPRVTTPRHVTRYNNTLLVVLPLLRNEANMVDLMLLEALKQFYPKLYKVVARHQHLLAGVGGDASARNIMSSYRTAFDPVEEELESAGQLVFSLFPKLQKTYGRIVPYNRNPTTEDELYAQQAVASAYYFKRYFSYAVQDGEIPDADFTSFLDAMRQHNIVEGNRWAKLMIARANEQEFTRRLEKTIDQVLPEQVPTYLELLRWLEDDFTEAVTSEHTMQSSTTLTSLYLSYVLRLPKQEAVEALGLIILRAKLRGALEFFSDITELGHWGSDHPLTAILTRDHYEHLCNLIVTRGLVEIENTPWYEAFGHFAPLFLRAWTRVKGEEPAKESLRQLFDSNPAAIISFLQHIAPLGIASRFEYENTNITQSTYEALKQEVDIHYLYQIASSLIKEEQSMPYKGEDFMHTPTPTERLHQLVYHYSLDEDNKQERLT